jgi:hypothetical protein
MSNRVTIMPETDGTTRSQNPIEDEKEYSGDATG